MNKRKCEIDDIYELEKYFKNYRIILFDDLYKFTKIPIYLNKDEFNNFIYLLYKNKNFYVVDSMPLFEKLLLL